MKKMAFIDMEGVLIPEIWPYLADCLGLEALKVTTRDIPDYQALMKTVPKNLPKSTKWQN